MDHIEMGQKVTAARSSNSQTAGSIVRIKVHRK